MDRIKQAQARLNAAVERYNKVNDWHWDTLCQYPSDMFKIEKAARAWHSAHNEVKTAKWILEEVQKDTLESRTWNIDALYNPYWLGGLGYSYTENENAG